MKNIKIIIATHKKYQFPTDKMYIPLHVGRQGKEDLKYTGDNTGENISEKNPFFCELTGLYWAWKNLECDYIGLVHYRRYFSLKKSIKKDKLASVLTLKQADNLLNDTSIILPKKRRYYIENLYDHFAHTTYIESLDITGEIIKEKYFEYFKEFENLKKRRSAHMFNMMIMKKDILNDYCKWLFDILFELEKRIDSSKYDSFHARFYGRVSELLLDVYINTKCLKYKEIPCIYMERINWWIKGTSFLKAKFKNEKYGKSF